MKEATLFEDFKLNRQLLNAVEELGFTTPTEIQRKCIPLILGGQEVIGIAQTGTGKTAAYMLPVLMRIKFAKETDPRAVVLAPTKELVIQLTEHSKKFAIYTDIRIMAVYGGVGLKSQAEEIAKGVDIIICTPGRFMELYLKGHIPVKKINTLVLDEADRMMDMGFMPQLRSILEVIPTKRQNLLFSATFHQKVEKLSEEFLEFPIKIETTPQATPSIQVAHSVYKVPNIKTKINLLEYLLKDKALTRVMIFTRTKENANSIFKYIERKGLGHARVIHSNKAQNARINAMNEFKRGELRILVTTDVTARGIDIDNVSHVINFDVPFLYEDYVHRIGRTGRAYSEGEAYTFVNEAEEYHIEKIQKLIRGSIPITPFPKEVVVAKTPFEEKQEMLREIDKQKRKEDPDFKGAFHEKKIK